MNARLLEHEIEVMRGSITDEMTGLANRRGFAILGPKVMEVADRFDHSVALIYADVDRFGEINDAFGHEAGDHALHEVAAILELNLRDTDLNARMGGDEFCALLSGSAADGAEEVVIRLRSAFEVRNEQSDAPYDLSLSYGIASAPPGPDRRLTRLIADADDQMHEDKQSRRVERPAPR